MLGMTQQPDTPPQPKHRGTDAFFDSIRGIGVVRSSDRWVGGVAGGLARRFGVDPLLVRGLFGASVLLGGLGLVLYGIAWLLLPEQADGRIHGQQLLRGDVDVAVLGAAAAIITGLSLPDSWGAVVRPRPAVLVARRDVARRGRARRAWSSSRACADATSLAPSALAARTDGPHRTAAARPDGRGPTQPRTRQEER